MALKLPVKDMLYDDVSFPDMIETGSPTYNIITFLQIDV